MNAKHVFVTVGTTKFEKLIQKVLNKDILNQLHSLGYTSIQLQTGNGKYKEVTHKYIDIKYNKYFENFEEEIEKADLVISHAGAGTCLQVLKKQTPLIVVINDDLMDNHQSELAGQLQKSGYLYYCNCDNLEETLKNDLKRLKLYPEPAKNLFGTYVNNCMGFSN